MKRTKSLAVVAGFAMVTLAACGGDGGGGNAGGNSPSEFINPESDFGKVADAEGPAPEVEGATTGGTITVAIPGDPGPEDLDPANGWSVLGNSIQQALTHRSLVQFRRDQETGAMELVPDLATDLGRPNEDFTEWTFTIKDVNWENGNPITAEEVKYGVERTFDSETFTSGPGQVYSVSNFDCGEGYTGPQDGDCPGITVDGQDITFAMQGPFPDMDFWSTFMAIGPIPLENSEFPAYGRMPLSSGPYKIKEFRVNESLTLEKNPEWDAASDPARHQYADEWVFKFDQDQEKTDQLLLSDSADAQTTVSNGLGATNVAALRDALGDNFIQQTGQCVSYRTPDYTKIDDINIRKAIAWAYDFENITLAGGNIPGVTRIPASTIMPPGMSGRKEYFPDTEQFVYDPEKSKALLAEAGAEGYKLTFVYDDSDAEAKAAAEQEKKGYENAGFTVEMIPYQEDAYALWDDAESPINAKLNLRSVNWCSDWPSASTMIPPLVESGQPYNTSYFSETEVDDRIKEIATLPLEDQAAAWGDLDELIGTKYFPMIPTAYRNDLFGAGSKIGGFTGDAAMSAIYYKDLFVIQ
ncbi:ABC transporter substrate-binding protein [Nocardioides psychrotolerans]|uniref:Peptide/nickel transport system substrate-binding protein n=1 Tax=Nocardioides psychrotolerans TaxID=1005945 RepID=A0A1I3KJK4_9ACTN|nr:ABC transporter substrate-binding protein [Nocardioides psychrotolerans]GEP38496.1 ABC transporter substrate-binding protein [Nocardioides psychrotolerans]SFI72662.1 peptide/nickel transport system substrate-binding protein [Nocardioides psychrotolerans]